MAILVIFWSIFGDRMAILQGLIAPFFLRGLTWALGSIAHMDLKLPSKFRDVAWPSPPTPSLTPNHFSKVIGPKRPPPIMTISDLFKLLDTN